jgi:hypothetical protein
MSDEFEHIPHHHSHPPVTQREQAEPQAATDEGQTQPAHDAFLNGGRAQRQGAGSLVSMLSKADSATRARIIQRLQQERGNAYVQRLMSAASASRNPPAGVQRQEGEAPGPGGGGAGGPATLEGVTVDITGGIVTVHAPVTRVNGLLMADTVMTNTVIASTYSPGAGNVW